MSGALLAGSALVGLGGQALAASGLLPAFIRLPRRINTIIPDVTIEEHFTDRVQITQHPVANNTTISDHAFVLPKTCTMKCGWTNANPIVGLFEGDPFGAFLETRAKDIYDQLLALQTLREPFQLTAGKRHYPNMLIAELTVTNDKTTEYALIIEVQMQEIIIVSTKTTNAPSGTGVPNSDQASPQTTGGTSENGTVQPSPSPTFGPAPGQSWFHWMGLRAGGSP